MPRTPGRTPLYDVPAPDADAVLQEIAIRYKAGKTIAKQTFDPILGSTYEEAERALSEMRTDVGKYSKYVFGIEPARVHRLWNNAMDDVIQRRCRQNKLLIIAPPNSAKSTYASIVRPAYYLGQNPDHHLLFFTSSDEMSKTFGSTVRLALEQNERHRSVFSENLCRPDRKRGWSSDGLYLKGTPPAAKDPAYKSVGFNATVMGARAHGIILDDVMDQKDAVSDIEQQKAKNYYTQTIRPRLHTSQGWLVAIMTRFHENDLASHFIKLAEESGEWLVIRTPMLAEETGDILGRYPGESLWPEQYTPEFIKATQAGMTIAEFNLVYQGDPTGMGGRHLRERILVPGTAGQLLVGHRAQLPDGPGVGSGVVGERPDLLHGRHDGSRGCDDEHVRHPRLSGPVERPEPGKRDGPGDHLSEAGRRRDRGIDLSHEGHPSPGPAHPGPGHVQHPASPPGQGQGHPSPAARRPSPAW
jgi:hypothetical protein